MSTTPFLTPGRLCLSLVAASSSMSCFYADYSDTHVYNPRWPPHAKFHNGQTMSMGFCLGLITAYLTWRPTTNRRDSVFLAAVVGSLYWLTGLSAILYPGTKWRDPEFEDGSTPLQPYGFTLHIAVAWLGYWLEVRRLAAIKSA